MSNSQGGSIGGTVIKTKELFLILKKPESVGIAFGLDSPGVTKQVHLNVYKVTEDNETLHLEKDNTISQTGAKDINDQSTEVNDYHFEHFQEMADRNFSFAFIDKQDFLELMSNMEKELFIHSTLVDFGQAGSIKGVWPTLCVNARSISIEGKQRMQDETPSQPVGNPPKSLVLTSCPPVWRTRNERSDHDGFVRNSAY